MGFFCFFLFLTFSTLTEDEGGLLLVSCPASPLPLCLCLFPGVQLMTSSMAASSSSLDSSAAGGGGGSSRATPKSVPPDLD